jgi:hypothetical protein
MSEFDYSVPDGDLKRQLFERYDRLNAAYEAAEARLAEQHIPHAVHVVYDIHPLNVLKDMGNEYFSLGVQKIKGKWRICHSIDDDQEYAEAGNDVPMHWHPIVEAAACVRVEAAEHLPKLEGAVAESHREFLAKVDEAIKSVERFAHPKSPLEANNGGWPAGFAKRVRKNRG